MNDIYPGEREVERMNGRRCDYTRENRCGRRCGVETRRVESSRVAERCERGGWVNELAFFYSLELHVIITTSQVCKSQVFDSCVAWGH